MVNTLIESQGSAVGSRAVEALAVHSLRLSNFRNYDSLRIETDHRSVALCGPNGAGKTNLLEALSFLAPGRGLRRAVLSDLSRWGGEPQWAISARLVSGAGPPFEIGTGIQSTQHSDAAFPRRVVRIDGADTANQSDLAARLGVIWLTPDMQGIFLGPASSRRRFLDRLVVSFEPMHSGRINEYERTTRERLRILRERGWRARSEDQTWLRALEEKIACSGVAVAAGRSQFVDRLDAAAALGVGPFPAAGLCVEGELEERISEQPAIDVEDWFRERLLENRQLDADSGRTTVGPHRSDLTVRHAERSVPAAACSTGEQKALLVSIVLAHARLQNAETATAPLLLLDEIAAHLDEDRRRALFEEVWALGVQAWMTATELEIFDLFGERAQRFAVSSGEVRRL